MTDKQRSDNRVENPRRQEVKKQQEKTHTYHPPKALPISSPSRPYNSTNGSLLATTTIIITPNPS